MAVQNRGVVASILPGLTPLQHCSRALELPSPFAFTANGDDDLIPPELKSAVQRLAELNDPQQSNLGFRSHMELLQLGAAT